MYRFFIRFLHNLTLTFQTLLFALPTTLSTTKLAKPAAKSKKSTAGKPSPTATTSSSSRAPRRIDPEREKEIRRQAEIEARRRIELDQKTLELQEALCGIVDAMTLVQAV